MGAGVAGAAVFAGVAGALSVAGALLGAGAEVVVVVGTGVVAGGFTGTFDFCGVLAFVDPPAALRTAATNGSPAAGEGTAPVSMLLNSTMRP